MIWSDASTVALRDVLADLYSRDGDYDRILAEADLPRRFVRLGTSDPPINIWQVILTAAGRRPPAVEKIIELAVKENSKHRPLTAAVEAFRTSQLTRAQENSLRLAADEARYVGDGLDVIAHHSDHRLAVAIDRWIGDFKNVSTQIDLISDYKDLHDQLHGLEFLYDLIVREAKRLGDPTNDAESLVTQELQLEQLVIKLTEVGARSTVPSEETGWIATLARAHEQLRAALDPPDAKGIAAALWAIKRVLAIHPSEINTRLNASARVLLLSSLKAAMEGVYRHLGERDLGAVALERLKVAIENLDRLHQNFDTLVRHHDRWQRVDLELRRLAATVDRDVDEFQASWPDVEAMVEALYESGAEVWVGYLRSEAAKIEEALADGTPARLRPAFGRYKSRCFVRFYQVDVSLKQLCGHLRQIGERLSQLVEKLRGPANARD